MSQDINELGDVAVRSLRERFGDRLQAVVLFGSHAREEAAKLSDVDFFIVARGLPTNPVERRLDVYDGLTAVVRRFRIDVSVIEMDEREISKSLTPLLVNIAHEGLILYDRDGRIATFFERLREAVKRAGLVRFRTSDGKYGWRPVRQLQRGEPLVIKVEGVGFEP